MRMLPLYRTLEQQHWSSSTRARNKKGPRSHMIVCTAIYYVAYCTQILSFTLVGLHRQLIAAER